MQQDFKKIFYRLLKDIKVELDDEFDRNFERKAFFNLAWMPAKRNTVGSLLMRTGALRKSLQSRIIGNDAIRWTSSLPYANIHNAGGDITVTPKMKGFFWYRFKMASENTMRKGGKSSATNPEAVFWKSLALKKVGSVIHIPKRQFIGDHPIVHQTVKTTADNWFNTDVRQFIDQQLNNMVK